MEEKCPKDIAGPSKRLRHDGLWGRFGPYPILCTPGISLTHTLLYLAINPEEFLEGVKEIFNAGYARVGISGSKNPAYAK